MSGLPPTSAADLKAFEVADGPMSDIAGLPRTWKRPPTEAAVRHSVMAKSERAACKEFQAVGTETDGPFGRWHTEEKVRSAGENHENGANACRRETVFTPLMTTSRYCKAWGDCCGPSAIPVYCFPRRKLSSSTTIL